MSVWTDFGFSESPYGTEPVPMSKDGAYLLVGRDEELKKLKALISSSTLHATIEGDNGVGKTSLVSVAAYQLKQSFIDGHSSEALIPLPKPFQLTSDDTERSFLTRVLYSVANAFIEHHDLLKERGLDVPSTGDINRWLNAPIFNSTSGEASFAGFGGGFSRGSEPNSGSGFSEAGFASTIERWLKDCFPTNQQGAFIGIIDNLELLETSKSARTLLESMRDTVLNMPGIKWVLCGARGIVRTGASSQRLEGRLLAPLELNPIDDADVPTAVGRREELYSIGNSIPPVGGEGFRFLYDVLNFNLRNSLKYCEDFSLWLYMNQPAIRTEEEFLRLLKEWLREEADRHKDETTLGNRAWEVFERLCQQGGSVSPSEHANFGFKSYQAMRPHLKSLEDNQLVQSSVDDTDQRRKTIVMTPRAWLVMYARNGYLVPGEQL